MPPDGDPKEKALSAAAGAESNGSDGGSAAEIHDAEPVAGDELPPLPSPATKAPIQFNQQVNVYQQIPQSAWDKLSGQQVFELSSQLVKAMTDIDKRHFDYAMEVSAKSTRKEQTGYIIGGVVAVAGITAAAILAHNGHDAIAGIIALPLGTMIAMILGRKALT